MGPKWDTRRNGTTWGGEQIEKALSGRSDFYKPAGKLRAVEEPASVGEDVVARNLVGIQSEVIHWLFPT
jgi:hypothetical protein